MIDEIALKSLLANMDPAFKFWCPKCNSRNISITTNTNLWSGETDYRFACVTCGFKKYGNKAVYEVLSALLKGWSPPKSGSSEKSKQEQVQASVEKHLKWKREQAEKVRREEQDRKAQEHREWMARVNASPPESEVLDAKTKKRLRDAAYRVANREKRNAYDRDRRARLKDKGAGDPSLQ